MIAIKKNLKIVLLLIVFLLPFIWLKDGYRSIYLDLDTARDLYELSNIWIGKIVWLGPELSAGFHASPLCFYLFYPVLWISGGNAKSIILFNIILSLSALAWVGLLGIKKYKSVWLLAIFAIGLSPWWRKISLHPGNGDTYVIFLLSALASIWFNKPLWLSSLLLGIAIAFHPAAIFVLPILLYEYWLKKQYCFKNLFFIISGLIIPWLPNIVFMFITKGYWMREWFAKPSLALLFSSNIGENIKNVFLMAKLAGLKAVWAVLLWLFIGLTESKNRLKIWHIIVSLSIILFIFISPMPDRYLYGITTIAYFIILLGFAKKKQGLLILFIIIILLTINLIKNPLNIIKDPLNIMKDPFRPAIRSIPTVENNINALIEKKQINKEQKIAVLAALKPYGGITPQANDYRFFLRTKNYRAPDVPEYSQADVLIMFIEDVDFDWQEWRSWEIDQFGEKKLRHILTVDQTRIIIFDKK